MLSRRDFLKITGATVFTAAFNPMKIVMGAQEKPRPNILWLSCEDIGPHLGCYGYPNARTPTLDQLAAKGARYENAFTVSGVCAPNRSAIITGMYASSLGTHHMRSGGEGTEHSIKPEIPAQVKCFSEYLRNEGYYCTNNSKEDYNFDTPESAWDESSGKAHWRNRPDPNQPFFAVFNYTGTHEGSVHMSEEDHEERVRPLTPDQRQDPRKLELPPYYPDTPTFRQMWADYYELITRMDYWVKDLLGQLEEDGLAEDTIVFFWSDHGVGLPRAKRWLYDSGTHIPLIVHIPQKFRTGGQGRPGTVEDRLVSSVDFGPTALNLIGIRRPAHMHGQPFLGPDLPAEREYVFGARDRMDERYDIIRMVRDRRYKYLRNYEPFKSYHQYMNTPEQGAEMQEFHRLADQGNLSPAARWFTREEKPVEELYDCQTDPHEIQNLAGDPQYQDVLVRMREVHERWMMATKDLGLIPEPELVAIEKEYGTRYAFFRQLDRDNSQLFRELHAGASLAGKPEIADLPALLEALDTPEPSIRYWGLIGIGNLGVQAKPAVEKVYHGLSDRSPVVRVAAARALYKMGHEGQEALPVLIDELQSPHEWVRLTAVTVLDNIGEKARPAIPALKAALNDTYNKYVVRVANRALNQMLGTNNQVR